MAQSPKLRETLIQEMSKMNQMNEKLMMEIPMKWENHGSCILFPSSAFKSTEVWAKNPEIFKTVAQVLKAKTLARKFGPIQNDGFRRPKVEIIYGVDPIVSKKENGIHYSWDITKCMFSSGNIPEKQRIASWNCKDQVIVDLYAGIGYFTLTYLVHSKAKLVYACEWNPDALKSLEYNLKLNKMQDKCIILPGDNQQTCPQNVAHHVNLGLIPSSEAGWPIACAALKRNTGGILHIHGNVDSLKSSKNNLQESAEVLISQKLYELPKEIPKAWVTWSQYVLKSITDSIKSLYPEELWIISINDIVKVKSYGPHIDHLVLDIKCIPSSEKS